MVAFADEVSERKETSDVTSGARQSDACGVRRKRAPRGECE